MNSCVLMAEIIQAPQLRYTSDNQTPIAEFLVQFAGLRAEDPPSQLKVIGWGNLAQEIQERYHQGDRILIEGRLSMNTVERPEGFKEKRAELTAQRIHSLASNGFSASTPSAASSSPMNQPASTPSPVTPVQSAPPPPAPSISAPPPEEPDYDDIPF
ncbi:MAG: single-stranded DNA-binding protein [Leptolyngbyaceae cyanobacterium MO_188.B28]|nr:single-stranded DNA-binding protein [Leptolyngbyaceae cyanobacterium MO_188.B28]